MRNSAASMVKGRLGTALLSLAAGFTLVAAAVHTMLGDPLKLYASFRSEKLVILQREQGTVTAAAFGSSHVAQGFDPRVFDAALARTPLAQHTVNVAVDGGSQGEQRDLGLEFLRMRSSATAAHPSLLLLELDAGANFATRHLVHPRSINIYDWPTTRLVLAMKEPGAGLERRLGRPALAFADMTMHYVNLGMLSSRILQPPLSEGLIEADSQDDRRGLHLLPERPGQLAAMQAVVAQLPSRPQPQVVPLEPGNVRLIEDLRKAATGPATHFVYLVMPRLATAAHYPLYPDSVSTSAGLVPILNASRPDLYPELYQPAYWYDDSHLDAAGATLVTRIFAQQLLAWCGTHPQADVCR